MIILDNLLLISETKALDIFLSENIQKVFDALFLSEFDEIKVYASKINSFYANNNKAINHLDYSQKNNSAFLIMIADFLERFDYSASFDSIIRLCNRKKINISSRLQASHLFLKKHTFNKEYLDIYDEVLCLLDKANKDEEDDAYMVTYTFSNYIHKVINDTHQYDSSIAIAIQDKVKASKNEKTYFFLEHSIIEHLINLNIQNYSEQDSECLQKLLSNCIRQEKGLIENRFETTLLIETDTPYTESLKSVEPHFKTIRSISVQKSKNIPNEEFIRSSLGRGVSELTFEEQLYIYFRDYGNMHKTKLDSAFQSILNKFDNNTVDIVDWGCGQALASIVFFDFINMHKLPVNISQLILIEPSELCLKRGALHAFKYNKCSNIKTVNKKLDDLLPTDLNTNNKNTKVHLFSNILDVEKFSIEKLVRLITSTQTGENYFICTSPYIDFVKAIRIETFFDIFQSNFNAILLSDKQNSKQGEYWYFNYKYNNESTCNNHPRCAPYDSNKNRWTRYEKVFKVEL